MPEYSKVMIRRSRLPRRMRSVPQVLGRRMAEFDRRNGYIARHPDPGERRLCAAPTVEVGIRRALKLSLRRKGDERRDAHFTGFKYTGSRDPRIRALERRKA